jgi:hypothetical protein
VGGHGRTAGTPARAGELTVLYRGVADLTVGFVVLGRAPPGDAL